MRFICRLALPLGALILGGLGGAGAQGVDVRQACTPDAMRLCNEFIPDEAKVRSCMLAKRVQLSQECRLAMGGGPRVRERHYVHGYHEHHYYRHYHH